MLAFMVIPVTCSLIVNLLFLDESPRVLMIRGHFDLGYEILIKTAKVCGKQDVVQKLQNEEIKHQI